MFVDDEPPVLNLLQALIRHVNPEWESSFAQRASEALRMIEAEPFDIVVSDMRMPEMNGAELLEQVREKHPRTARLILSGFSDVPLSLRSLAAAHQYLAKPFTLAVLQSTLTRLFSLERLVPDRSLQDALGRLSALPTSPATFARFTRELVSPGGTIESVANIIAQDPALTAKVLQLVNSAFFGPPHPLVTARDAVQGLGFAMIRNIATNSRAFWEQGPGQLAGFPLETIARHSVATGVRASRIISLERGLPDSVKLAFTAGVLHDVGKIALAAAVPELHRQAVRRAETQGIPLVQAEGEVIGATHAQAGAYLLGLWGLPETIVDIVACHHQPGDRKAVGFGPLAAVHVANWFENHPASGGLPTDDRGLDKEYLAALRIDAGRLNSWLVSTTAE